MNQFSALAEIEETMGLDPENPNMDDIPRERVKSWMQTEDIEAQGALFELLIKPHHYKRIVPPLNYEDYHTFMMQYYERCLRENPDGEWSDSRYSAGWSLVNWFVGLWNDPKTPRSALAELKVWLANLYKSGDEELRTCLVTATLEHLFERREIAQYFSDWKKDKVLKTAFTEAIQWAKRGKV